MTKDSLSSKSPKLLPNDRNNSAMRPMSFLFPFIGPLLPKNSGKLDCNQTSHSSWSEDVLLTSINTTVKLHSAWAHFNH